MTLRRTLVSLVGIALFFLLVMIATYVLFSTVWSKSAECSVSCKRLRSAYWTEDPAEQYPDESWANIPEELYEFFTPPPRFVKQNDPIKKCVEFTPPVGYLLRVKNNTYSGQTLVAVLVRRWVLFRNFHTIHIPANESMYVRLDSRYKKRGGVVIRVTRIVNFKVLGAAFLEHPVTSDCMQFASLLTDKSEIETYVVFTTQWPGNNPSDHELREITVYKNSSSRANCGPMFVKSKNTYMLCGFTVCHYEKTNESFIFKNDNSYREWLESL